MKYKIQNYNRFLFVCSVCVILLFLILNIYTPLIADDFSNSLGVHSIGDVCKKMYDHYIGWTGRTISSFLILFWLLVGKPLFNIANTIMYCAFIFLVQFHVTGKRKKLNLAFFLALNVFFWFFVPAWGQDFLWLTGSCVYLWPTVISLFFLAPFRKKQDDPDYKLNLPFSILFFLVGILAGWSYENLGAAILFLLIAYSVTKIYRKSKFTLFEIFGVIGFLIGFSLLIAAPGNYARTEGLKQNDPLFFMLIKRFASVTILFIKNYGLLFVLISVLLGFDLVYHQKRKLPVFSYFYFLAGLAGTYSMLLAPYFPDRAFLITTVFSVISLGNILTQMEFRVPEILKRNIALFTAVVLIGLCPSFLKTSIDIMRVYLWWYDRVEFILVEKEKGNLEIEVGHINTTDKHVALYGLVDIVSDESDVYYWTNSVIASYFGLKSIKCNYEPMEPLWMEKEKRIRQIITPPWGIIKQARNYTK